MKLENIKVFVNLVTYKANEEKTKKFYSNFRKVETLTELIAQYQLDHIRLNYAFKLKVIKILKTIDVRYLPNESHPKYYLLCYAVGYKPRITLYGIDMEIDNEIMTTMTAVRNVVGTELSSVYNIIERNYIRFFYKFYLHILFLMIIIFNVFTKPDISISFLFFATMYINKVLQFKV